MYDECGLERRGKRKRIYRVKAVNPGQGKEKQTLHRKECEGDFGVP
jgi:hypothetical protein